MLNFTDNFIVVVISIIVMNDRSGVPVVWNVISECDLVSRSCVDLCLSVCLSVCHKVSRSCVDLCMCWCSTDRWCW